MDQPAEQSSCNGVESNTRFRIPPYLPDNPSRWFEQLEREFENARITADTKKFTHALVGLDGHARKMISHLLKDPPTSRKYEKLKSVLLQRATAANEERIRKLLCKEELGNRRPSQFLSYLSNRAGIPESNNYLKLIWVECLPKNYRTILTSLINTDKTTENLTEVADTIYESTAESPNANVASSSTRPSDEESVQEVFPEPNGQRGRDYENRRRFFREGCYHCRYCIRGNISARSRDRTPSPESSECWYHRAHGHRATRCRSPCSRRQEFEMRRRKEVNKDDN